MGHEEATVPLDVVDLGRMAYGAALRHQRQTHDRVVSGAAPSTLLLVEHEPVITVTRRRGAASHLRASRESLARMGIDVVETDRGGDVTYHGPGQLVAYPIVSLQALRFNIGRYLRWLEQVIIDAVASFDLRAFRLEGLTGVWVEAPAGPMGAPATPAKLCALGVRVEKGTTLHGAALNVTTQLDHFETIVPCGLADRPVTSLQRILGDRTPPMRQVKRALADTVLRHLARRADPVPAS